MNLRGIKVDHYVHCRVQLQTKSRKILLKIARSACFVRLQ